MPDKEKEAFSVYDKVRQHGEAILSHDERISSLEEADRRHEEQIVEIKANNLSLENTMMKESRETQDVVKRLESTVVRQNEKLYGIVDNAMGIQANREVNDHELRNARLKLFGDLALKGAGVVLALASSGGILYLLAQQWFVK